MDESQQRHLTFSRRFKIRDVEGRLDPALEEELKTLKRRASVPVNKGKGVAEVVSDDVPLEDLNKG